MVNTATSAPNEPALVAVLNILAFISFAVGIYACVSFYPERLGYGESWKSIAYLPSAGVLAAGFAHGLFLVVLGQILKYLAAIAEKGDQRSKELNGNFDPVNPVNANVESQERQLMETHGIQFNDGMYHVNGFDYDTLAQAVNHAISYKSSH